MNLEERIEHLEKKVSMLIQVVNNLVMKSGQYVPPPTYGPIKDLPPPDYTELDIDTEEWVDGTWDMITRAMINKPGE